MKATLVAVPRRVSLLRQPQLPLAPAPLGESPEEAASGVSPRWPTTKHSDFSWWAGARSELVPPTLAGSFSLCFVLTGKRDADPTSFTNLLRHHPDFPFHPPPPRDPQSDASHAIQTTDHGDEELGRLPFQFEMRIHLIQHGCEYGKANDEED